MAGWPLHAFLCKGYLYSLHHILSGPSIFSRIFSNIENILTSRRSTETKSRSKPAQNLQNLKISVGIDPKPTVEGGIAVSSSLVKTVLDAAQRQRQEYSRISLDSRSTKGQGLRKARIFLREKPAGASVFSRIFSNMEVRGTLYILKDIREYGVKAKPRGKPEGPQHFAFPEVSRETRGCLVLHSVSLEFPSGNSRVSLSLRAGLGQNLGQN